MYQLRVEDWTGDKMKKRIDQVHNNRGIFTCMLHNDAWFNNYMFKCVQVCTVFPPQLTSPFSMRRKDKSGKATDICTIDLQLSRLARPTVDLAYFLGSSCTPKFR